MFQSKVLHMNEWQFFSIYTRLWAIFQHQLGTDYFRQFLCLQANFYGSGIDTQQILDVIPTA